MLAPLINPLGIPVFPGFAPALRFFWSLISRTTGSSRTTPVPTNAVRVLSCSSVRLMSATRMRWRRPTAVSIATQSPTRKLRPGIGTKGSSSA